MDKMGIIKPATKIVHWPGQDTACCDFHAQALMNVGLIIGCHVSSTPCEDGRKCTNCENEASHEAH